MGDRTNRDSFDCSTVRKHFLTKQDINNIQTKVKDFGIKRHENDAVSVSVIVEELRGESFNPVLIYKPQGTKDPQYPMLTDDTFILALQTKFQKELYEAHASTILCIDSTHGTNQYRFKLITCIVPDNYGKGTYVCVYIVHYYKYQYAIEIQGILLHVYVHTYLYVDRSAGSMVFIRS